MKDDNDNTPTATNQKKPDADGDGDEINNLLVAIGGRPTPSPDHVDILGSGGDAAATTTGQQQDEQRQQQGDSSYNDDDDDYYYDDAATKVNSSTRTPSYYSQEEEEECEDHFMPLPPLGTPLHFPTGGGSSSTFLSMSGLLNLNDGSAIMNDSPPLLGGISITGVTGGISASAGYEMLGRQVMAAASTASATLNSGFDLLPPWFPTLRAGPPPSTTTTPGGGLDPNPNQFTRYPEPDSFPLAPYVQSCLDETFAACTIIYPHNHASGTQGGAFFQVTAYIPRNDGSGNAASVHGGMPPLLVSSSSGSRLEQDGNDTTVIPTKKKNIMTRARPLPLRKRKVELNQEDSDYEYEVEEDSKPSAVAAAAVLPPLRQVKKMYRHNQRSEDDTVSSCSCKKSKCLKLYCDCFQSGKVCDPNECECKGCKNTEGSKARTNAIEECIKRRPDAFEPRTREDDDQGCRCRKSQCLKMYCICFNQGVECSDDCRCKNCKNGPGQAGEASATASLKEEVVVASKAKKTKKAKPSVAPTRADTALKNELLAQFDPSSFTYKPPTPQFWGAV